MFRRAANSHPALRKYLHTEISDEKALARWLTAKQKILQLRNVIPTAPQLDQLFRILPTRMPNDFGTHEKLAQKFPEHGDVIDAGHYLVMPSLHPNSRQRPDGSPAIHAPPPPWTRKLWTGGKIRFKPQPLLLGLGYVQKRISIVKKYARDGPSSHDTYDTLVHTFLESDIQQTSPTVRMLHQLVMMQWFPQQLDFIMEERETEFYTERYDGSCVTTTTLTPQSGSLLFEFKATASLISTFCSTSLETHRIHSDLKYANEEGYPNLVIPVQLQLIMMLDILKSELVEKGSILEIEYQVLNPLFAERNINIYRHWLHGPDDLNTPAWQMRSRKSKKSQRQIMPKHDTRLLWTSDDHGVVGVIAKIFLRPPQPKLSRLMPWVVGTHGEHLVYAKRAFFTKPAAHQSLEDGDRRAREEALALPNQRPDNGADVPNGPTPHGEVLLSTLTAQD